MRKRRHLGFAACAALVFLAVAKTAHAAIPTTINHQGYLTDASGVPVNGTVNMVFTLYKADNSSVWTETQTGVTVAKGVYSVMLGSVTSLAPLPFDEQYFLGIKVGSDPEMSPRQALASAAYAMRAARVDSIPPAGCSLGGVVSAINADGTVTCTSPNVIRWTEWDDYSEAWLMGNTTALYGGVSPQNWSSAYKACNLSYVAIDMRAFFNRKIWPGYNAMIVSDVFANRYDAIRSRHAGALLRIRNSTASPISWNMCFYYTGSTINQDVASVSLNGACTWSSPGDSSAGGSSACPSLTIPANRVSTVTVISSSIWSYASSPWAEANLVLGFHSSCLNLPAGLSFADDLDLLPWDASVWIQ
jgi:hypothetical protein